MSETYGAIKKFSDIIDELHNKSTQFLKMMEEEVNQKGITGVMAGRLPKVNLDTPFVRAIELWEEHANTGIFNFDNTSHELPSEMVTYEKSLIPEEDFTADRYHVLAYKTVTVERIKKAGDNKVLLTSMAVDLIRSVEFAIQHVFDTLFYAPAEKDGVVGMITPSANISLPTGTNVDISLDADAATFGAVGAFYLLPRMVYEIRLASDSSLVATVFVVNKDANMKTITVRNVGSAAATLTAGTKYYFTFKGFPSINGFAEITRQTGTLHGINRATEEWFRAYVKNAAGSALSISMVESIQRELARRARAKGYPDADFTTVYTTEMQIQNIIADYHSLVQLNTSPEKKRLSWGGWSIVVNGTEFVYDPLIPYGYAYFFTPKQKYIRFYRDKTKNVWQYSSSAVGVLHWTNPAKPQVLTYPVEKTGGIFCPVPNVHGLIYNLGNDYDYS